jgi:hypothetical protein
VAEKNSALIFCLVIERLLRPEKQAACQVRERHRSQLCGFHRATGREILPMEAEDLPATHLAGKTQSSSHTTPAW